MGAPEQEPPLSPREREVLRLVARGLTSKAIGSELGVSRKTVETHVAAAMAKLGASTRLQAAAAVEARPAAGRGSRRRKPRSCACSRRARR